LSVTEEIKPKSKDDSDILGAHLGGIFGSLASGGDKSLLHVQYCALLN